MTNEEITWDLSEVFPSVTHPSVQKAIDNITKMAERFAEEYYRKIKNFDAHGKKGRVM